MANRSRVGASSLAPRAFDGARHPFGYPSWIRATGHVNGEVGKRSRHDHQQEPVPGSRACQGRQREGRIPERRCEAHAGRSSERHSRFHRARARGRIVPPRRQARDPRRGPSDRARQCHPSFERREHGCSSCRRGEHAVLAARLGSAHPSANEGGSIPHHPSRARTTFLRRRPRRMRGRRSHARRSR